MKRTLFAALVAGGLLAGCSEVRDATRSVATSPPAQIAKDALIAAGVKAKLAATDIDSATNVRVRVENGRVALEGAVRSPSQRGQFAELARSVGGVTAVDDRLRVDPKLKGARDSAGDLALAARVSAALAAQTGLNAFSIRTEVRGGNVSLRGAVPSVQIKATMLETARKVNGVHSVVDRIRVQPERP